MPELVYCTVVCHFCGFTVRVPLPWVDCAVKRHLEEVDCDA